MLKLLFIEEDVGLLAFKGNQQEERQLFHRLFFEVFGVGNFGGFWQFLKGGGCLQGDSQ